MNCAACGDNSIPFPKAWVVGPWFRLTCPRCQATLRVQKQGAGKFSSYALGVPVGILVGLGLSGVFWNLPIFLTGLVAALIVDILIDARYASLMPENRPEVSGEEKTPSKPDAGDG